MKRLLWSAAAAFTTLALAASTALAADVKVEHRSWAHNAAAFNEASAYIAEQSPLNLLAFPAAKLVKADGVDSPQYLTDGSGGEYGGSGRVAINAKPSKVVY